MFGLFKTRARKTLELEARLSSPSGEPIYGEIEFDEYNDGSWRLEIELKHRETPLHMNGPIDVRVDGVAVGAIAAGPGVTYFRRSQRDGPLGIEPQLGQRIEIVQGGSVIAAGEFEHDD
ncbi:MAG: hypothetical protein AAFY22_03625 [Pseudomonadota bacterium]